MMRISRRSTDLAAGQAGFTLVEMLVVLAIIGLLAAVAASRIQPASRFSERSGAIEALREAIADARRSAMQSGRQISVNLSSRALAQTRLETTSGTAPELVLYPDGTTNGGTLFLGDQPIASIEWLQGKVIHAS